MLYEFPPEGSIFSGFEEEICRYLRPAWCDRENYASEMLFQSGANKKYVHVRNGLEKFLKLKSPNPYQFSRFLLDDWKNLWVPCWHKNGELFIKYFKEFIEFVYSIHHHSEDVDFLIIETADRILKLCDDPQLPEPILKAIAEARDTAN